MKSFDPLNGKSAVYNEPRLHVNTGMVALHGLRHRLPR